MVGGAGFGKTTLLAQARAENRLAPQGDDLWLRCGPADAKTASLARGLAAVLEAALPASGGPDTSGTAETAVATTLADAVWRLAPRQVCLILDDVHHLPPCGPAAALVAAFLDALPANGHMVLASRREPSLASTHHDLDGQVLRIDERDLAFDAEELQAFAECRGVMADCLDGVGGWPALVELRAGGRPGGIDDFLAEEVLRELGADQRRTLATVAAIGGCDRELLAAVSGHGADLAAQLGEVPLVSCDGDGWWTAHPVWSSHPDVHLATDERTELQRAAGRALLHRDAEAALDLVLAAGDETDVEEALRQACRTHRLPVSTEGLHRLHRRLPTTVREGGRGQLVAAIATAAQDVGKGVACLKQALHRCRRDGDEAGALLAVEHLSVLYHWIDDAGGLRDLWRGVIDHALPAEREGFTALADAFVAAAAGDGQAVLRAIGALDGGGCGDDGERPVVPHDWGRWIGWLRATALTTLGFPEAARSDLEVAMEATGGLLRAVVGLRLVDVQFLTHHHDEAFATVDRLIRYCADVGSAAVCCLAHCRAATLHAQVGRVDVARQHLHRATLAAGPAPHPAGLVGSSVKLAGAVVELAAGDEEGAARLLREQRGDGGDRATGAEARCGEQPHRLALHYVLEPETRRRWDAADLGPVPSLARELARALAALRDAGDVAPAARLGGEHWAAAPTLLPLGWQAELAVAAAAGGSAEGRQRAFTVGPTARPALRRVATARRVPDGVRRWALTVLDVPAVPPALLRVDVLGPARLQLDGRSVDHPQWRRQRVRALLLFLVARQGASREEIAAALWPDLDPAGAARNLRVNLSYLIDVLEPGRTEREPSCFVHTEATSIRLASHDRLSVDAWEMERLLDQARVAERGGEPSVALGHLRRAVAVYRGPYLADAGYEPWALPHRDRLAARFVAAAVRAGELALAAGDPDDALHLASRALEEEPYSEPAHRLAIAAHLTCGDVAAAHRAFATCCRRLEELGVSPSPELHVLERPLHTRSGSP